MAFPLFELPKPAMAAILSALDDKDREQLPHVCREWHAAFYKEPLCSRRLSVHLPKWPAPSEWPASLEARAPHTEELTLRGFAACPDLVSLFTSLQRLAVDSCAPLEAWEDGPVPPSLLHLELRHARNSCHGFCLWLSDDEDAGLLKALSGLQSLSARFHSTAEPLGLCEGVASLPGLTALELGSVGGWEPEGLQPLERLTRLRRLVLHSEAHEQGSYGGSSDAEDLQLGCSADEWGDRDAAPFPLPGLPLTHLAVTAGGRAHKGLGRPLNATAIHMGGDGDALEASILLGEGLAQLPLLELHLDGHIDTMPADLWGCTGLTRLVLRGRASDRCLEIESEPMRLPPLEGARLPHLRALGLNACALWRGLAPGIARAAPQLTALALTEVALCWGLEGGCPSEELCHLSRLAGLQELDLSGSQMSQGGWDKLLPALTPLRNLRSLKLACCGLRVLPEAGPYAKLEHLDLCENYLAECPAWLPAACPLLRYLDLGYNGSDFGTYEDPHPMTLTEAVRQLAMRTDGARLEYLTVSFARYLSVRCRRNVEDPRELAACAIFDELMAAEAAGRLALGVADERFPAEVEKQPEGWLA